MKIISDTSNYSHLSFKSGLTNEIIEKSKKININAVQNNLLNHNIESNLNSQVVAFAVQQVFNIFNILKSKTNAKLFNINIPSIQTYVKEHLIFDFQGYGFCIPQSQLVLKNQKPFKTGSVFFEEENSIEYLNNKLDNKYKEHKRSSSHYLSPFIHKFLHNVYLNYIYTNYSNNALKVLSKLQNLTFNNNENKIIAREIGTYATSPHNQYHEFFAETFTKLICDSLSTKSLPKENPLDRLKTLPQEFLVILAKLFNI